MNSYYQDPNLQAALLAQAAYENERQNEAGSEGGGLVDFLGKTALVAGLGVAAGIGGRRLLTNRAARGATQKVTVEDLGNIGRKAEADVRSAQQRYQAAPAPSQPPPSQPTPGGMVDRLGKMAETTRQARSERMPGVIQADLSEVSPENARAALKAINDRVLNPRNATAQEGIQSFFQESPSYGQLPKAGQQAAPEVKALPPARTTGTDFLTSQLGGRGYIEQTILDRAAEQAAGDLIDEVAAFSNQSARSELATQAASVRSQQRKNLWNLVSEIQNETLVDQQQTTRTFNVDQTINALDAAEDQQTGRVKQQLQRNEDINLSRVDFMEDMAEANRQAMIQNADPSEMIGYEADASINQVAVQLPDGLPVDQAEQTATRSLSSQELADIAKTEMMALRQDLASRGLRPGTQRFERALAQSWTTKSLPGVQPGTQEFRRLQELGKVDISLPSSVRKAVDVVGVGADPTGFVPERTVVNIGPQAQITSTAAGTAIRGASPSYYEAMPITRERQLTGTGDPLVYGAPDEMGPDIPGSARVTASLPSDIPQSALSKQEIKYSFLNKPPQPELAGGSAGIGVYGIEPAYVPGAVSKATGEYSAASERQPSYVPGWLQRKQMRSGFESLTTPQLQAAAEKTTGRIQQSFQGEVQRRRAAQEGLAVSEALRRSRIEGRDPQMILRQLGIGN
jgi:hypothetical protein